MNGTVSSSSKQYLHKFILPVFANRYKSLIGRSLDFEFVPVPFFKGLNKFEKNTFFFEFRFKTKVIVPEGGVQNGNNPENKKVKHRRKRNSKISTERPQRRCNKERATLATAVTRK